MTAPNSLYGTLPLTHWGAIRARGTDAFKFLQSQLTNDVALMDASQVRLAGFCSAKGRLQASFIVWKQGPDEFVLTCAASVLPATLKRLSMFVLRAQCRLGDAGDELALHGIAGDIAAALVGDTPVWGRREIPEGSLARLPDAGGIVRCMLLGSRGAGPAAALALPAMTEASWRALEVRSGIPIIEAATVDRFVPQMLNLEIIGGVDFHKGCYPGQEVVARSQYRGTIKRRMFLFECDAPAAPGQEVFHSTDPAQPAGMVVNAAPLETGAGSVALVEVKLAALAGGGLHLGTVDGARLVRRALPYEVPEAAAPGTTVRDAAPT